ILSLITNLKLKTFLQFILNIFFQFIHSLIINLKLKTFLQFILNIFFQFIHSLIINLKLKTFFQFIHSLIINLTLKIFTAFIINQLTLIDFTIIQLCEQINFQHITDIARIKWQYTYMICIFLIRTRKSIRWHKISPLVNKIIKKLTIRWKCVLTMYTLYYFYII
ncbi:hypothetical protein WwSim0710, partial [Wolbachia endosymbiont of Drosophila simulans]